jgi:hypothetical protein
MTTKGKDMNWERIRKDQLEEDDLRMRKDQSGRGLED